MSRHMHSIDPAFRPQCAKTTKALGYRSEGFLSVLFPIYYLNQRLSDLRLLDWNNRARHIPTAKGVAELFLELISHRIEECVI